jgi:TRAP-type mannitol/chloroaromatic compound transport system permease small subunit
MVSEQPQASAPPPPTGQAAGSALHRTIRGIDAFSDWSGKALAWLTVPMMFGLVIEVIARYLFGHPTIWAYDVTYMLYGSLFMLGAAYALYRKAHIRTDMIYMRLPVRRQGLIDATLYILFFFPGMLFFLVASWEYFMTSWQQGEIVLGAWGPPIYPFKAVLPLSAALLLIQGVSELLKSLHAARRGEWL